MLISNNYQKILSIFVVRMGIYTHKIRRFDMKKWMALLFLLVMGLVGCQKEIEPLTIRITWKAYSGRGEAIEKVVNDSPGLFKMIGGDENLEAIRSELSEVSSAVLCCLIVMSNYFLKKDYYSQLTHHVFENWTNSTIPCLNLAKKIT